MLTLEKALWGTAVGGLAVALPFAGVLPTWSKSAALAASFFASSGLVAIESIGKDWRKYKLAQQRIENSAIESQYSAVDALNATAAELQYQFALKSWIVQNAPIEAWENSFAQYGLTPIALPEIQAAREALSPPEMPRASEPANLLRLPQTSQGSVVDAALAQVEAGLDTEWFGAWGKRSGIVCGESSDGKSYLLLNVVLAQFLKDHTDEAGKLNAKIYICDPDYGSSHGDTPPNTWLDLPVGKVVYTADRDMKDIYLCVMHVSKLVDDRAAATSVATQNKQPKPQFDPVLLIVDEEPMVAASLSEAQLDDFVLAVGNILRRGIKQNVTFKMGTQTLAVGGKGKGGTRLNMDLLRQIEMVLLWRAAQVKENYANLGVRPDVVEEVLSQVLPLPRQMGSKRVCVTYLDKQLQIAAVPTVLPVQVESAVDQDAVEAPAATEDIYTALLQWQAAHPEADDRALLKEFQRHTDRHLNAEGLKSLKDLLRRMGGAT